MQQPSAKRRRRNSVPKSCRVDQRSGTVVYSPQRAINMFLTSDVILDSVAEPGEASHDTNGVRAAAAQLYTILQTTTLPRQQRGNLVGHPVSGAVLGMLHMLEPPRADGQTRTYELKETKQTKLLPDLYDAACQLMKCHDPTFEFTAVQVNLVDYESKLHIDRRNSGASYIIAMGDYCGGGHLQVMDRAVDIHNRLLKFHGQLPHRAMPHTSGTRYSVVFFTSSSPGGTTGGKAEIDVVSCCSDTSLVCLHPTDQLMTIKLPTVCRQQKNTVPAISPATSHDVPVVGVWPKLEEVSQLWRDYDGPGCETCTIMTLGLALNHAAYVKHTWKPPSNELKWHSLLRRGFHYIQQKAGADFI